MLKNNKHPSLLFLLGLLFFLNTNACSPTGGIQPTISPLSYTLPPTQTSVPPSPTFPPPTPSETTPAPTSTITVTITPLSTCNIANLEGKYLALGNDVFFFTGPDEGELDRTLANHYPEWANYEQNVQWDTQPVGLSQIIISASFEETFALNPAVTLVTLGVSEDWELPSDGDVYSRALTTGERLVGSWYEWSNPGNEHIRARYPEIANGATYALYEFFDYDKEQLQVWCDTYQDLFGTSPFQR